MANVSDDTNEEDYASSTSAALPKVQNSKIIKTQPKTWLNGVIGL